MTAPAIAMLSLLSAVTLGQMMPKHKPPPRPQRAFSAEDLAVDHPVYLPGPVFTELTKDNGAHYYSDNVTKPSRDWFSAEKLRSPAAGLELFMVMANGPLRGANVSVFWLVQYNNRTDRAEILWSVPTHNVKLRYRSGAAYPAIQTFGATALHITRSTFRYRHGKYVLTHSDDSDI